MLFIFLLLWWLSGLASFIFWWTSEYEFTLGQSVPAIMAGFLGPMSFLVGWLIHGNYHKD